MNFNRMPTWMLVLWGAPFVVFLVLQAWINPRTLLTIGVISGGFALVTLFLWWDSRRRLF